MSEIPLWNRSMALLHGADRKEDQHIHHLVQSCASFAERTTFKFRMRAMRPEPFKGTLAEIKEMLRDMHKGMARGLDIPLVLATDKQDPLLVLSYVQDLFGPRRVQPRIEVAFSLARPLVGLEGYFSFEELIAFFGHCIAGYKAARGYIYDSQLAEIITEKTSREAMRSQLSQTDYKYIPVSAVVEKVPPDLVERLGHLHHPGTFDIIKVPAAVYWINYWGAEQVKVIGEERVRSAPWAFTASHPGGGLILASQREMFDALNPKHLERLAGIVDIIDLYAVQDKHRFDAELRIDRP